RRTSNHPQSLSKGRQCREVVAMLCKAILADKEAVAGDLMDFMPMQRKAGNHCPLCFTVSAASGKIEIVSVNMRGAGASNTMPLFH
ncbi:hypothetical protein JZU69_04115, partial [bacterium]|nr:hypothetical protein [bacterium]